MRTPQLTDASSALSAPALQGPHFSGRVRLLRMPCALLVEHACLGPLYLRRVTLVATACVRLVQTDCFQPTHCGRLLGVRRGFATPISGTTGVCAPNAGLHAVLASGFLVRPAVPRDQGSARRARCLRLGTVLTAIRRAGRCCAMPRRL